MEQDKTSPAMDCIHSHVRKEKKHKKVAFAEWEERFNTNDAAKHNIKLFKDVEDLDGDPYTESQQELLSDYVEVEEIVADAQLQLESIKKRRRHTFRVLCKSHHFISHFCYNKVDLNYKIDVTFRMNSVTTTLSVICTSIF